MKKDVLSCSVAGMLSCMALSADAVIGNDHELAVRELGSTNVVVKKPGYFFYCGEYVQPPYVVTREGDELKINGRFIKCFCKWPLPKQRRWHVTHEMPKVPESVTEKTSMYDPVVNEYQDACYDFWLTTLFDGKDYNGYAATLAEGMSKLPCVKRAWVDGDGGFMMEWNDGTPPYGVDYLEIAEDPSCWEPLPVNVNDFIVGGNEWAEDLAKEISVGRCLFSGPNKGSYGIRRDDIEQVFASLLPLIDGGASAEDVAEAARRCGQHWDVERCADIIAHKVSLDGRFRDRIARKMARIRAAKRAEMERKEVERKRREEARARYAEQKAKELAPTVEWTPDAACAAGKRFYEYYKSLRYSGEPFVPYAFWPRSTQPGGKDKWKFQLRENSVRAFSGFLCSVEDVSRKITEDISAGARPVGGKFRPETIQWVVACDFPVATDKPKEYARIPMMVSSNLNPKYLLSEWDGKSDADERIPLGPASGAEKTLFGDRCVVILFNNGEAEAIPADELTYKRIYKRKFTGPQDFGYLTVSGFVKPVGLVEK